MKKLAIVCTHPIQYYCPWFRFLAAHSSLELKVFFLWEHGTTKSYDPGFQQDVAWDIPLLDGYESVFLKNKATHPGTHHFSGIWNPSIVSSLRSFEPDCILLIGYFFPSFLYLLLRWSRSGAGLLLMGDSHRLYSETGFHALFRRHLITFLFRRFRRFLYVGRANRDYLSHHGVPFEDMFFAPHAVDDKRLLQDLEVARENGNRLREQLHIAPQERVVVFAGKFEEKKRPRDLLQAFLQANVVDSHLLFVGSGELEDELKHMGRGNSSIHFLPFQNQSKMPDVYSMGDLFVLPSYGKYETWGLAIHEAMLFEKPVLVSDHVGCSLDLVKEGTNGLIFPAGDVSALASCLEHTLSDTISLEAWGKRSKEIVSEYSYATKTKGLLDAIESCCR